MQLDVVALSCHRRSSQQAKKEEYTQETYWEMCPKGSVLGPNASVWVELHVALKHQAELDT